MNIEEYENQLIKKDDHEKHLTEHARVLDHIQQHIFAGINVTPSFATIANSGRATGRTTKMILQALTGIAEGKRVYIVAPTHRILENIRSKLHASGGMLGLGDFTYLVRYIRPSDLQIYGISTNEQETLILYDHTCSEHL